MLYLLEVTVYSALLYAVYLLILKNRASHDWNRLYLLLCAALPLMIPFIKITALSAGIPVNTHIINTLLPEINVFSKNNDGGNNVFNWGSLLAALYVLGALAILLRSIIQYITFRHFVRQHKYEVVSNVKVLLDTKTGPGSFQDYIFLPDNKIDPAIFEHELAHIRLKHSNDILFLRLLQGIFWPNVALYMISRELKIVHEFQADTYAVRNKEAYITTLLNDTFCTNQFSLSHTFFYHPLKRRIMMLQRPPLSRTRLRTTMLKTVSLATLLLTGIVYLQSCMVFHKNKSQSSSQTNTTTGTDNTTGQVYEKADVMPQADYKLSNFLAKNIKYPGAAREHGIEGKVIVKFVVDEAGNITQPEIVKSPDTILSDEALRVVRLLPKWKPGMKDGQNVAVSFRLPIMFSLAGAKNKNVQ